MALMEAFRATVQTDSAKVPEAVIQGGAHRFIKDGFIRLSASQMGVVTRECIHPLQHQVRNPESVPAQQHISVLADIMKRDQWLPYDKIDFAKLNGRLWLVNGTHRAFAQLKSGKTLDWTIVVHNVADETELRSLFYRFDTNVRARTSNQVLVAAGFDEEHDIPRQVATAVYGAMVVIAQGFKVSKATRDHIFSRVADRRLAAAGAWAKEAKLFAECVKGADTKIKRKLLRSGVAAVALVTLRYQKEMAINFWTGVAENDGLKKQDPRRTLVMDLLNRDMGSGLQVQSCIVPALAWNSWFTGSSRSIIKVTDSTRLIILGTPFDGSRK